MLGKKNVVLAVIIVLLTIGISYAANEAIKRAYYVDLTYYLNGAEVGNPPTSVFVETANGKTLYLPLRQIAELLGLQVSYDAARGTVSLQQATIKTSSTNANKEITSKTENAPLTKEETGLIDALKSKDWKVRRKAVEDIGAMGIKGGFAAEAILDCRDQETNQLVIEAILETIPSVGEPVYKAITARVIHDQPGEYQIFMLFLLESFNVEDPQHYLAILDYYFDASLDNQGVEEMRNYIALLTSEFRNSSNEDITNKIVATFTAYLSRVEIQYNSSGWNNDEEQSAYRNVIDASTLLEREALKIAKVLLESEEETKINDGITMLGSIAHEGIEEVNSILEEAIFDYRTREAAIWVIIEHLKSLAAPLKSSVLKLNIEDKKKAEVLSSLEEVSKDHYIRPLSKGRILKIDKVGNLRVDYKIVGLDGSIELYRTLSRTITYTDASIPSFSFTEVEIGKDWSSHHYKEEYDLLHESKDYFTDTKDEKHYLDEAETYILMYTPDRDYVSYVLVIEDDGETHIHDV